MQRSTHGREAVETIEEEIGHSILARERARWLSAGGAAVPTTADEAQGLALSLD